MTEITSSPLAEANPRSIEEIFSSKPPFDARAIQELVKELRRMREKWQQDELQGKAKKAKKAGNGGVKNTEVVGDLFGEETP